MKYQYKRVKIDSGTAITLQNKGYKVVDTEPILGYITFKVPTKQSKRRQLGYDVIVTAIESDAVGYWAKVSEAKIDDDDEWASAKIRDIETDKYIVIYPAWIENVMKLIINGNHQMRDDIFKNIAWAYHTKNSGDIDVEIADVIIQIGLFGEIIYG